ncbi:hypothetical protein HBB16_16100 [Pseudonocardia sp. MCCB 268]|nr:hypothetical protein [Pseudonocardia cytotoxica]
MMRPWAGPVVRFTVGPFAPSRCSGSSPWLAGPAGLTPRPPARGAGPAPWSCPVGSRPDPHDRARARGGPDPGVSTWVLPSARPRQADRAGGRRR